MRYMILALLLVAGCSHTAPKLILSDNTGSNVAAVASFIPAGTDATTAAKQMSDAGFT